jgi:hypothetical protein
MRDEALIHFHYEQKISVGIELSHSGFEATNLIEKAMHLYDRTQPNRCVAAFCATHLHLVEDIVPAPPRDWQSWRFSQWDQWFGRINGVFLVDMKLLKVAHYPMYRSSPVVRQSDFSKLPKRLAII